MKNKNYFSLLFYLLLLTITQTINGQYALHFKNADYMSHGDFVYCGSPNYSFSNQFTVALWIKWTTDPKTFAVTPANHENEGQYSTYISISAHNNRTIASENLQFTLRNEKTTAKMEFVVQNASGTKADATSSTVAVPNQWYFVAGVYDGSKVRIYVNGTEQGTANLTGNVATHNANYRLSLGRLPWGYGFFVGYMDDVRIWNTALSAAEILQQYNQPTTVNSVSLKSYWDFNAGAGTVIDDQGSQNADGTFYSCLIDVHSYNSGTNTITDNDKDWTFTGSTSNYWKGCDIKVVSGEGIDETNSVSENTAIAVTFSDALSYTPIFDGTNNMTWYGVLKATDGIKENTWVLSDAPLPVQLIDFTAKIVNYTILLNWATVSEIKSSHFEVEKLSEGIWKKIAEVKAAGYSNSKKEYSCSDNNLLKGKNTYRLKQVDNDGSFDYNREIEVDFNNPITFNLENNFPNPFNPQTNIRYELKQDCFVSLKVYDVIGNEVATLVDLEQPTGFYNFEFNAKDLASGTYFVRMKSGNFDKTIKINLLK